MIEYHRAALGRFLLEAFLVWWLSMKTYIIPIETLVKL